MTLLVAFAQAVGGVLAAFLAGALVGALIIGARRRPEAADDVPEPKPDGAPNVAAITRLQQRQQRVLDAVADGVIGVDSQGRTEFTNPAACAMLGRHPRELMGAPISHLILDDAATEALAAVLDAGETRHLELASVRTKSAGGKEVGLTMTAIRDKGKVTGAVLAMRDLTRLREQEAKLRESEAHLKEAQSTARLGSWDFDVASGEVYWSDELYRIFGLEIGIPMNRDTFMEACHPDDQEALEEAIGKAMASGESYVVQHRVVWPDGEIRHVRGRGRVVMEDGQPVRMFGTAEDITDEVRMREMLSGREQLFQKVVEATSDYVSILDGEGRFLYNNRLFEAYKPEDILGHDAWEFVPEPHAETWKKHILETIATDDESHFELMGLDENGQEALWNVEMRPFMEDGERRVVMITRIIRD